MKERIQKALATAGIASRREVERMIGEGRILVNGRPAEVGQKVSDTDHLRVDGKTVTISQKPQAARVLIYRKRTGELVTRDDPEGRRTVFRKLPELETGRWIAVGRLDINTSGLLLMTNSGELARRLTHPSFEMVREYAVRVLGAIDNEGMERLRRGVKLEDGMAKFTSIERGAHDDDEAPATAKRTAGGAAPEKANQWFRVTVMQGRNRVVRRLFESQDLQVSRLIRVAYGPIELGRGIKTGGYREADPAEVKLLLDAVGLVEEAKLARKPRRR